MSDVIPSKTVISTHSPECTCDRCLLIETWARVSAIERHLVEQKGTVETPARRCKCIETDNGREASTDSRNCPIHSAQKASDERYCPDGEPHRWADGRCRRPGCGAQKTGGEP